MPRGLVKHHFTPVVPTPRPVAAPQPQPQSQPAPRPPKTVDEPASRLRLAPAGSDAGDCLRHYATLLADGWAVVLTHDGLKPEIVRSGLDSPREAIDLCIELNRGMP